MSDFRKFVDISETTFSQREVKRLGLHKEEKAVRKEYLGWEVWFYNRIHDKVDDNMTKFVNDFEGRHEDESEVPKMESLFQEVLHKQINLPGQRETVQKLSHYIDQFKKHYEAGENGWSSNFLSPKDRDIEELIHDKLKNADINQIDHDLVDSWQDIYLSTYTDTSEEFNSRYYQTERVWLDDLKKELDRSEANRLHKAISKITENIQWGIFSSAMHGLKFNTSETNKLYKLFSDDGANGYRLKATYKFHDVSVYELQKIQAKEGNEGVIKYLFKYAKDNVLAFLRDAINVVKPLTADTKTMLYYFNEVFHVWTQEIVSYILFKKYNVSGGVYNEFKENLSKKTAVFEKDDYNLREKIFDLASDYGNDKQIIFHLFYEEMIGRVEKTVLEFSDHIADHKAFEKYIIAAMTAVKKVIDVLMSFGVRNFHKVPIVFYYQNWDEPSGWGKSSSAGKAYRNYIAIYGMQYEREIISILAHEIGHIVYDRLPAETQNAIKQRAHSGYYTRDYGKPDYVYDDMEKPGIHHEMGNEWFATMIEYMALHQIGFGTLDKSYNHPTPQNTKTVNNLFTQTKKDLSGAPNMGSGYKKERPDLMSRLPRRLQPRKKPKPNE